MRRPRKSKPATPSRSAPTFPSRKARSSPAGTQLAKTPRKVARTKDITGGLPRVAELFEARKPKDACVIAKIDGDVSFGGNVRGKKKVIVTDAESGEQVDHLVPMGKHIIVTEGDRVKRGDQITEGPVSPEDLLEACGAQELQEHLVNEVQSVYRVQGVEINDKHIEVIIRQMLRKVKITDPGDADQFLWGDQVDRSNFKRINARSSPTAASPPKPSRSCSASPRPRWKPTRSSPPRPSRTPPASSPKPRPSARSITSRGFKENVIMGHLIPAGTGFHHHRESEFEFTVEEPEPIVVPKETFDDDEDAATA